MPLLNDPTRGRVINAPNFFQQRGQQEQNQQFSNLKLQQLRKQIEQIGVESPESGSSVLARIKAQLLQKMFDPATTPEQKKQIIDSGVFGGARQTVNVNQGGQLQKTVGEQLTETKKAQTDINAFVANPENSDIAKALDFSIETNAKGIPQLNITQKKQPTSEQINKKEFLKLLRAKVERINEITSNKKLTGPIQGPVRRALAETVGGQTDFVELKQLLDSLIIRVYMLSGKQINETELRFLQSIQPQDNDPTDTFDTRLKGFYNELKTISLISEELWNEAGIRLPSGKPIPRIETPVTKLSAKDAQAITWARKNKNDPRAKAILKLHGVE